MRQGGHPEPRGAPCEVGSRSVEADAGAAGIVVGRDSEGNEDWVDTARVVEQRLLVGIAMACAGGDIP